MLIKTTRERYAALEQALRAGHPYELPEIIAVPIERGLPAYLDWVAAETTKLETHRDLLPACLRSPLRRRRSSARRRRGRSARAREGVPLLGARARRGAVEVRFAIADGYYLYRDRFSFAAEGNPAVRLGAPEFPRRPCAQGRVLRRDADLSQERAHPRSRSQGDGPLRAEGDLAGLRRRRRVLRADGVDGASLQLAARRGAPSVPGAAWVDPCRVLDLASDLDIAAPVRGQLRARARRLPRVRAAARVYALRAADDPDPVRHHRRRGRATRQARARLCFRSPMSSAWRSPTPRPAWRRRLRRRSSRPPCRTCGCSAPSRSCSCCSRCRCSASTSCSCPASCISGCTRRSSRLQRRAHRLGRRHGRAFGGDRQPLRRGAARRGAALHLAERATCCSAARRCSRWRSAWACR